MVLLPQLVCLLFLLWQGLTALAVMGWGKLLRVLGWPDAGAIWCWPCLLLVSVLLPAVVGLLLVSLVSASCGGADADAYCWFGWEATGLVSCAMGRISFLFRLSCVFLCLFVHFVCVVV